MTKAGLLAACLGALLLALSTHLGVVSGFVGIVVWAGLWWRLANITGWLLLVVGFLLQYVSVRQVSRAARHPSETEAILKVLESKGILTQAEVLEELSHFAEVGKSSNIPRPT
jgi:Na+/proline symporter